MVTGLKKETSYQVHVRVHDKAGNYAETVTIPVTTGKEQSGGTQTNPGLRPPTVTVSGTQTNGYYTGNITVKVTDNATTSTATKIKYTQDGVTYKEIARAGKDTTFTITQDGRYTVNAYMIDSSGNESGMSNVVAFAKDTVAPTTANLYVNEKTTNTISVMAVRRRCNIRSKKLSISKKYNQ